MVTLASDFSNLCTDALEGQYHKLSGSNARVRRNVQLFLEKFKDSMEKDAIARLRNPAQQLVKTTSRSTWREEILANQTLHAIDNIMRENRGREFRDEINSNVMKVLWHEVTTTWMDGATKAVDSMVTSIGLSVDVILADATDDLELRTKTNVYLQAQLSGNISKLAKEELKQLIEDESHIWTLVPQYSLLVSKLHSALLSEVADSLLRIAAQTNYCPALDWKAWDEDFKLWLANNRGVDAVILTYVRLQAYYQVASKHETP